MSADNTQATMTTPLNTMNLTPLTKAHIIEVMDHMRLMGGAPASDKMKKAYVCRLGGLLKRGALQVLDRPEEFKEVLDVNGRTAISSFSFVKSANQFMNTLCQTGRWHEFYAGDLDSAAIAYRQLTRELSALEKAETACRKREVREGTDKVLA
jgi:hypothetical protein